MEIDITAITALGMALTPVVAQYLKVPKKLRSFLAVILITLLNMGNAWLYGDDNLLAASKEGIIAGLMAVGIYSTGKNAIEQTQQRRRKL
ncbi:hypothetical protein ACH33_12080 [Aneurinibacillus sp. XH2]|uniref:hypothetical protein n=1 Tax=Aneurinibacillus sp. XH2 TaxID=1450761 RepID=UPI0007111703|nr:hypothetical protein [Aneurinibacillus sp. XH2]AMA73520.1 hypothetical protein ACH33_12080 [Aneurinibacillus sp. XH2]